MSHLRGSLWMVHDWQLSCWSQSTCLGARFRGLGVAKGWKNFISQAWISLTIQLSWIIIWLLITLPFVFYSSKPETVESVVIFVSNQLPWSAHYSSPQVKMLPSWSLLPKKWGNLPLHPGRIPLDCSVFRGWLPHKVEVEKDAWVFGLLLDSDHIFLTLCASLLLLKLI